MESLLLVFFFSLSSVRSQITEADTLLEFKRSIIPSSSFNSSSDILPDWNPASRQLLCNWTGISCGSNGGGGDGNSSVSKIDLGALGIGRALEPGSTVNLVPLLDDLEGLVYLNLSGNILRGELPSRLDRCASIELLDLSSNLLGGEVPPSLGNCSQLEALHLGHNNLTGVLPASIGKLSRLTTLDLEENNITGQLPSFLGDLLQLQVLNLIGNNFWGSIPPSLANCSSLRLLFLFQNAITGRIPDELGRLQSLQTLGLDQNFISGPIPPSLANCSSLTRILLYYNNVTGEIPREFATMRQLFTLELSGNQLTGSLEDFSFSQLHNLTYVSFAANRLHGAIPADITNCSKLINMDFSRNYFSGSIPVGLGRLAQLARLNLHDNQLEGGVSQEIGNLSSSLLGMFLNRNQLHGEIPAELSGCQSLVQMDLSENRLIGSIPRDLCKLSNVEHMNLSTNLIGGVLPDCLNQCSKLTLLDLSWNLLEGRIPSSALVLPGMALGFSLAGNRLQGSIPVEIGSMTMVEKIDLSRNNLTGPIPREVSRCIQLESLDLSWNDLSGVLPGELGQLSQILEALDLSHNRLTGSIPQFLTNMSNLKFLNLSDNEFFGAIPPFSMNFSSSSFGGNPALCGELIAKPCSSRSSRHLAVLIVAPFLSVLVATLVSIFCWCYCCRQHPWRRHESIAEQELDEVDLHTELREFSVAELWDATDGYAVRNIVAVTSNSTVYRALLEDGTTAAVKRFKRLPEDQTDRFVKELTIILGIRHRNLVKVLGYCRNRSLVLEFMSNGSLDTQLHRTPCKLSWTMRVDIALGIVQALVYMHEFCDPPVVHCDLKPGNILLDEDFEAHVADFGISKLLQSMENTAESNASILLRGTLGYIPPEYGFGTKPTVKGDVYGLGVILLELVTGLSPTDSLLQGVTLHEWVASHSSTDIVDKSINLAGVELIDVERMINLGLLCSSHDHMDRPSISDVHAVLQKLSSGGSSRMTIKSLEGVTEISDFVVTPR